MFESYRAHHRINKLALLLAFQILPEGWLFCLPYNNLKSVI
jgi:hypothetical protein